MLAISLSHFFFYNENKFFLGKILIIDNLACNWRVIEYSVFVRYPPEYSLYSFNFYFPNIRPTLGGVHHFWVQLHIPNHFFKVGTFDLRLFCGVGTFCLSFSLWPPTARPSLASAPHCSTKATTPGPWRTTPGPWSWSRTTQAMKRISGTAGRVHRTGSGRGYLCMLFTGDFSNVLVKKGSKEEYNRKEKRGKKR